MLADLQNSSRGTPKKPPPGDDFPPPPNFDKGIPISQNIQLSDHYASVIKPNAPPTASKQPKNTVPLSQYKEKKETDDGSSYNLTELEGLLQDLDKASDLHRKSNARQQQQPPQSPPSITINEGTTLHVCCVYINSLQNLQQFSNFC